MDLQTFARRITTEWKAELRVHPVPGGEYVRVHARLEPTGYDALGDNTREEEELLYDYGWQVRLRATLGRHTQERWSGSSRELTEEHLVDSLPYGEDVWLPIGPGPLEVRIETRVSFENEGAPVVGWLRGRLTLPLPDGPLSATFGLEPCEPLSGGPFEPTPAVEGHTTPGPELPPGKSIMANLPETGVLVSSGGRTGRLWTPEGWSPLDFGPDSLGETTCFAVGPGGRVAFSRKLWSQGTILAVHRLSEPQVPLVLISDPEFISHPIRKGAFDPTGRFLVFAAYYNELAVLDLEAGRVTHRWRDIGMPDETGLFVDDRHAHVAGTDWVGRMDLRTGEQARRPAPTGPGRSLRAIHPVPGRVAWTEKLACSKSLMLSVVGWHDVTARRGGQVALPEYLQEPPVVLEDGRIVVSGVWLWRVHPESGTVERLTRGQEYGSLLQVTQSQGRCRVWFHDPGKPWYHELP